MQAEAEERRDLIQSERSTNRGAVQHCGNSEDRFHHSTPVPSFDWKHSVTEVPCQIIFPS